MASREPKESSLQPSTPRPPETRDEGASSHVSGRAAHAPLTASQERVVAFIRRATLANGYPPSLAEIAEGLGFRSPNAAAEHVRLLAKKGVLLVTPRVARGIRLAEDLAAVPASDDSSSDTGAARRPIFKKTAPFVLPLIGHVAAGRPILAAENIESRLDLDPSLFFPTAHYLLRVRGDSMIDAGIYSGDLLAVHKTPVVETGRIAVVRLEDEVTVKRFKKDGRTIVLEAANPAYAPIIVDPASTSVAIEGLAVGLLRRGFGERIDG